MWSSSRKRITSLYGKHQRAVTSKKIWYNPTHVTFVQLNIRRANISIPLFSVIFFGTNDGDGAMFVSSAVCLHSIFTSCLKCSFIRSSRFVAGSFRADRFLSLDIAWHLRCIAQPLYDSCIYTWYRTCLCQRTESIFDLIA